MELYDTEGWVTVYQAFTTWTILVSSSLEEEDSFPILLVSVQHWAKHVPEVLYSSTTKREKMDFDPKRRPKHFTKCQFIHWQPPVPNVSKLTYLSRIISLSFNLSLNSPSSAHHHPPSGSHVPGCWRALEEPVSFKLARHFVLSKSRRDFSLQASLPLVLQCSWWAPCGSLWRI